MIPQEKNLLSIPRFRDSIFEITARPSKEMEREFLKQTPRTSNTISIQNLVVVKMLTKPTFMMCSFHLNFVEVILTHWNV